MRRHWLNAGCLAVLAWSGVLLLAPSALAQPATGSAATQTAAPLDRARLFDTVVARIEAKFWDPQHLVREKFADAAKVARTDVLGAPDDPVLEAGLKRLAERLAR